MLGVEAVPLSQRCAMTRQKAEYFVCFTYRKKLPSVFSEGWDTRRYLLTKFHNGKRKRGVVSPSLSDPGDCTSQSSEDR